MTNRRSLTFILILLLIAIWLSGSALDAHAEWERILDELTYSIASDGERLYVNTENGMYYSRDDGDTWRWSDSINPVGLLIGFPDAVYGISREHGFLRSDTKGKTWRPINTGIPARPWDDGLLYPYIQQIFVTASGATFAVGRRHGTWISHDRGDNWRQITGEWKVNDRGLTETLGNGIESMGEFGGYLWLLYLHGLAARSPDDGATWEALPRGRHVRTIEQFGDVRVWLEFRGNLYVAGSRGFGRLREEELEWEDLSTGLPDQPKLYACVVHRDRIFAGAAQNGVFMFDHHAGMWHPAGLSLSVYDHNLVSHRGFLYAATLQSPQHGVYRAKRPFVFPEGKAAVTWGAVKTK